MNAFAMRYRRAGVGLLVLGLAGLVTLAVGLYAGSSTPKSLLLPEPLSALPDLGDYAWNPLARPQWAALLLWLGVVELLGWLAWPVAATVCRWLPDRGYPLSKTLALVLVAWPVWLAASLRLAPFTVWSIGGAIGLLALVAGAIWRRDGRALRAYLGTHRRLILAWEGLFLLAFGAFLALRLRDPDLWQPARGGEKPMDFGFLNALLRSAWMPPPDPFFAGGYINYYYYGQFLIGCLVKLVGCAPAVAYNLALPLLYALLVLGAASLVYNAVASVRQARGAPTGPSRSAFGWSLAGVGLVALAGNLHGGLQVLSMAAPGVYAPLLRLFQGWGLTAPGMSKLFTSFDYWPVTRVAPRIIDEFPYWIFLFGELHAHEIALPFTLLVLGLTFNLLLGAGAVSRPGSAAPATTSPPAPLRSGEGSRHRPTAEDGGPGGAVLRPGGGGVGEMALRLSVLALALGALAVINTWDFVTYGGILIVVTGLVGLRALCTQADQAPGRQDSAFRPQHIALALALVLAGALLAYAPYFLHFQAFYNQVRPLLEGVDGQRRTKLAEWLIVWGLFAFLTASYVAAGLRRYPWAAARTGLRGAYLAFSAFSGTAVIRHAKFIQPAAAGMVLLCATGAVMLGYLVVAQWLIALLAGLLGATLAVHLAGTRAPGLLFAGVLLASALAATLGVEFFYVADFLQTTEWFRMNTVFKFYMQAWVLFGTGSAIALYALLGPGGPLRRARSWAGRLGRGAWLATLGILLLAAGVFLVFGTQSRLADAFPMRPAGPTLDGLAFMDSNQFAWGPITNTVTVDLRYDHAAYDWLITHAHGLPIIATAPTAPDPEGMFVATYTGFPVVVGSMHQEEQRYPEQVAARRADMAELFRTPDPARALVLLARYHVTYIYLGPYERALTADAPAGRAKFTRLAGTALAVAYQNPGVTIYQVRSPAR